MFLPFASTLKNVEFFFSKGKIAVPQAHILCQKLFVRMLIVITYCTRIKIAVSTIT